MNTAMKKEFMKAQKVVHPNSRKSIAIAKRAKKISNRQKAKTTGLIKQNLIGEKIMWMKEYMVPDVCPYTPELTARLLESYISRNDEEMEQINIKRSVGGKRSRQHASREDMIRMTREREMEEYNTCGIEIPDILNATQCEMLRNWSGELKYLTNFKFRRFGRKHLNEALLKAKKEPKLHTNEVTENTISDKTENTIEEVKPESTISNKTESTLEEVKPVNTENSLTELSNSEEDNPVAENAMDIE